MRMEVGSYVTLNDNHSRALRGKNNLTAVSGSWKSARRCRVVCHFPQSPFSEPNFRIAKNYRPIGLDRSFQRKRLTTKWIVR